MRARVRIDTPNGNTELATGSYVIGRAPECDVVVTSGLASRRHARLVVDELGATIEDLGTPNGTFVNGEPLQGLRALSHADFIVIGDMALEIAIEHVRDSQRTREPGPVPARDRENVPGSPQHLATIPAKAYEVLAATADPFFELNQLPIAEKVLEGWLLQVLEAVKTGAPREPDGDVVALRQGARLAHALGSARWLDYCVELASELSRPFDPSNLVALDEAVRRSGVSGRLLDGYLGRLGAMSNQPRALETLEQVERWRAFAAPR